MMPRENEGHHQGAEERESDQQSVSNDASRVADAVSMANAMQWVSRITTVVLEMCLPTLAGHWLDGKWGTNFLVLVGLVLGVTLGIYHLILMTNQNPIKNIKTNRSVDSKNRHPLGRKNGDRDDDDRDDDDPLDLDELRKL